mmetsp:Transcript_32994/g.37534  ORF Transcript_32994/g.37534 Transcript_32994/m.37534 type:complete len:80 (+) Transcript_32994:109-348(+)
MAFRPPNNIREDAVKLNRELVVCLSLFRRLTLWTFCRPLIIVASFLMATLNTQKEDFALFLRRRCLYIGRMKIKKFQKP